jgi:phosphoglycolate phosphatase-like HAD superfamily hydrolase
VPTPKLILWDIDHTLIETGGVGSEVFRDAFQQVTGRQIDRLADVTGRTEEVIFRETLDLYDIEDPGDYFPSSSRPKPPATEPEPTRCAVEAEPSPEPAKP